MQLPEQKSLLDTFCLAIQAPGLLKFWIPIPGVYYAAIPLAKGFTVQCT